MYDQSDLAEPVIVNGLNVTQMEEVLAAVKEDPALATFEFRARNVWDDGGYNLTTIRGFYGGGEEHGSEDRVFEVDADEPPALLGEDRAPNPAEYLLHALASCLTSTIVVKAAARGIRVDSIESSFEGDIDAQKFLEISDVGRTGYRTIRARFKVSADASAEEIRKMMDFSPIFDVVRNGTEVSLLVEKA